MREYYPERITIGGIDVTQINLLEAGTELLHLIQILETHQEEAILIARAGKPVAELRLSQECPVNRKPGIAKGKFHIPEGYFGEMDREIADSLGESL